MKDSYLDTQPQAKHIEFEIWQVVLLRRFTMLNFMKPRVSKMKMRILMMLEVFDFQIPRRTWMLVN
jgi:hypothetical protein